MYPTLLNRATVKARLALAAATALCLAWAAPCAFSQAANPLPPGAPETPPTTLNGAPAPGPTPLPSSTPVTEPLPTGETPATVEGGPSLGLSLTMHTDATGQPDGAFVSVVEPGGPGAVAGVQDGDVITALNGVPVSSPEALTALLNQQMPGATVQLSVLRNGAAQLLTVLIGTLPPVSRSVIGTPLVSLLPAGPSPFAGTYKGQFRLVFASGSAPQVGTLTLRVEPSGTATGLMHNNTIQAAGVVGGSVSETGEANLTLTYTGGGATAGTAALYGALSPVSDRRLAGALVQDAGAGPVGTVTVSTSR